MSVHQVSEYYVYIEFKDFLTDEQLSKVIDYINSECLDSEHTNNESIHVDIPDEIEAELFNEGIREKFGHLIK